VVNASMASPHMIACPFFSKMFMSLLYHGVSMSAIVSSLANGELSADREASRVCSRRHPRRALERLVLGARISAQEPIGRAVHAQLAVPVARSATGTSKISGGALRDVHWIFLLAIYLIFPSCVKRAR